MISKTKLLLGLLAISLNSTWAKAQYYTSHNTESDLAAFSTINGQWISVTPANNTVGTNYYQGLNFGFDVNNYSSITNPIGTNELYFGRWEYAWKRFGMPGI